MAYIQHSVQYLWRNCSCSIKSNGHISHCQLLSRSPTASLRVRGHFQSLIYEKHSDRMLMTIAIEQFYHNNNIKEKRVLPKSPFDYIPLSPHSSSLILMSQIIAQESRCFDSSARQVHSERLTACGRAGAQGSGGRPAGPRTWR